MRQAAALVIALTFASSALAETPLPALNGNWNGTGQDRDTPFQALQNTNCKVQLKADARSFVSETLCEGVAGLRKRFRLAGSFEGENFTGDVLQTSKLGDGETVVRRGKASGVRKGDVADMTIRFPGLTPNAYVTLALISPSAFSMKVRALGSTLTDVNFRR